MLEVSVRDLAGNKLAVLDTFSNLNRSTPRAYVPMGPYSLRRFRGQTIRIVFESAQNRTRETVFNVDEVGLNADLGLVAAPL